MKIQKKAKATMRNDVATFDHHYTAEEINVFMTVVNRIQNNQIIEFSGLKGMRFKIKEIKEIIGYSADFREILKSINQKQITGLLKWDLVDDKKKTVLKRGARYSIVPFVSIGEDDENYLVKIHPEFYPMIKDLEKNYTSIELESFLSLASMGLKNLYKFLLTYKHKEEEIEIHGEKHTINVMIEIEELKKMLGTTTEDNASFIKNFKTQTMKSIVEKTNIYGVKVTTDGRGKRKATKVFISFKVKEETTKIAEWQIEPLNEQLEKLCKKNLEFSKGAKDKDFNVIWRDLFKEFNGITENYGVDVIELIIAAMKKIQNFKFDSEVVNPKLTIRKQIKYILENEIEILQRGEEETMHLSPPEEIQETEEVKDRSKDMDDMLSSITGANSFGAVMDKKAAEAIKSIEKAKEEATEKKEKKKITQAKYDELYRKEIEKTGLPEAKIPDFSKKMIKQSLDKLYEIISFTELEQELRNKTRKIYTKKDREVIEKIMDQPRVTEKQKEEVREQMKKSNEENINEIKNIWSQGKSEELQQLIEKQKKMLQEMQAMMELLKNKK